MKSESRGPDFVKFRVGTLVRYTRQYVPWSKCPIPFGGLGFVTGILDYDKILKMEWISVLYEGRQYHLLSGDFERVDESQED